MDYGDLLAYNAEIAVLIIREPDKSLPIFNQALYETLAIEDPVYADRIRKDLQIRIRGIADEPVSINELPTYMTSRLITVKGLFLVFLKTRLFWFWEDSDVLMTI